MIKGKLSKLLYDSRERRMNLKGKKNAFKRLPKNLSYFSI
jgi:hypothetical protein